MRCVVLVVGELKNPAFLVLCLFLRIDQTCRSQNARKKSFRCWDEEHQQ